MLRSCARRLIAPTAILAASVTTVLAPGLSGAEAPADAGGGLRDDEIRAIVTQYSALNGESNPSDMRYVHTNRAAAQQASSPGAVVGSPADGTQDVFLVTAHGHFTGYALPIPRGASPPTGAHLSMVLDAGSGAIMDVTLGDGPPADLSTFGSSRPLG